MQDPTLNEHFNKITSDDIIDLAAISGTDIGTIVDNPLLLRFFGMHPEDGTFQSALERGAQSLRKNSYIRIIGAPNIRKFKNDLETFIAPVLCYLPIPDNPNGKLIRYNAHIGPMLNIHRQIGVYEAKEEASKLEQDFSSEHYTDEAKRKYFKYLIDKKCIIHIIESQFDPFYPNNDPKPIQIKWAIQYHP